MVDLMVETKTIIFWNTHLYSSSVSSCINVLRSDGIMYAGLRVVNLCWVIGLGCCGEVCACVGVKGQKWGNGRNGEMGKRGKGGKSWEEEKKKREGNRKERSKVSDKESEQDKKQEKWQETRKGKEKENTYFLPSNYRYCFFTNFKNFII